MKINKTGWTNFLSLLLIVVLMLMAADGYSELSVSSDKLIFPTGMKLDEKDVVKKFSASENGGNFTAFENVKNLRKSDGKISFTLTKKPAILNWGNVSGKQPVKQIKWLLTEQYKLRLRVKQSGGTSQWSVSPYRDGKKLRMKKFKTYVAECKGSSWNNLLFTGGTAKGKLDYFQISGGAVDGLEFIIKGKPGTHVEISGLECSQKNFEGYARYEFDLPKGKIWSAVADVISKNRRFWYGTSKMYSQLYINGQKVKRNGGLHVYHTAPVVIAKYLKPGQRNVVAFYGYRTGYTPPLAMQAEIVMVSGKTIKISSGPHWKYSSIAKKGWNQVGFDDSSWKPVKKGTGVWSAVRDFGNKMCLPTYTGSIKIDNPESQFLFFNSKKPAILSVRIPAGFAAFGPQLEWVLGKAGSKGEVSKTATGKATIWSRKGDSLTFKVNLGKRPSSVYVVALRLIGSDGKTIATRSREPLVVIGKIDQKVVSGDSYTQGMDLQLETSIDFTNKKDPTPWHEWNKIDDRKSKSVKTPTIIKRDGLTYRQTCDTTYGTGFSYRFEFKHPGDLYLLELSYPDNEQRLIEAAIVSKKDSVRFSVQSSACVETGGKFYPTGKIQKLRWIQTADNGPHSIDIVNGTLHTSAAASGFKVYRIKGKLPSVGAGLSRLYGIHTERQFFNNGYGRNFGMDRPMNKKERKAEKEDPVMKTFLKDLVWMKNAAEKYVQYMKFAGQNTQVIGCMQYTNYNTIYAPLNEIKNSRIPWCSRTMLAHLFNANDISFFAGMEYSQSLDIGSEVNSAQVALGADTINIIEADGRQRYVREIFTIVPNFMHPVIQKDYLDALDRMVATFEHLPNFKGIHNFIGPSQWGSGYWMPGLGFSTKKSGQWDKPLIASFDDITMNTFMHDTGIKLPGSAKDPERFQKRAKFIKADAKIKERFLQWRADQFTEFMKKASQTVGRGSKDYEFVNVIPLEDKQAMQFFAEDKVSFKKRMRDLAIDLDALNRIGNFWTGRWTLSWRQSFHAPAPHQDPNIWFAKEDPAFISAFDDKDNRYVMCRTSWDENHYAAGDLRGAETKGWGKLIRGSDWIQNKVETTMMPQPSGVFAREALCQAMITADPVMMLSGFTDVTLNLGHEQTIRSIIKPYSNLPREKFKSVMNTGLTTNLAIRVLKRDKDSWFYVVNPGFWPFKGKVNISSGADIISVPDGKKVAGRGKNTLDVELEPFGLKVYKCASPSLEITAWETAKGLNNPELEYLRNMAGEVFKMLKTSNAKKSLSGNEQLFMKRVANRTLNSIKQQKYAQAWSMIKDKRFWNIRIRLLKAKDSFQQLPKAFAKVATDRSAKLPTLTASKVSEPVKLDADITKPIWAKQPFQCGFVTNEKDPSILETGVKAAWSDKALYLLIACSDSKTKDLQGKAVTEDTFWKFGDDAIALYIQPDMKKQLYYQMAFNGIGTLFDQRVKRGSRDYKFKPDWKVKIKKENGYWIAEVMLPYKGFGIKNLKKEWGLNIFRRFRKDKIKYSCWSFNPGSWHNTKYFGKLKLK